MDDQGFTLADVLAALFIVSLAMMGLGGAVFSGARLQKGTADALARSSQLARASSVLDAALAGGAVYRATTEEAAFKGAAESFSGPCGRPAPCAAALRRDDRGFVIEADGRRAAFDRRAEPRFRYMDQWGGVHESWPVATPRARLAAVAVVDAANGGVAPLLVRRLWIAEEADCAFDPVAMDCLEPANEH